MREGWYASAACIRLDCVCEQCGISGLQGLLPQHSEARCQHPAGPAGSAVGVATASANQCTEDGKAEAMGVLVTREGVARRNRERERQAIKEGRKERQRKRAVKEGRGKEGGDG
jgi:hypothetical protein